MLSRESCVKGGSLDIPNWVWWVVGGALVFYALISDIKNWDKLGGECDTGLPAKYDDAGC